jgi:hypothetical protein
MQVPEVGGLVAKNIPEPSNSATEIQCPVPRTEPNHPDRSAFHKDLKDEQFHFSEQKKEATSGDILKPSTNIREVTMSLYGSVDASDHL